MPVATAIVNPNSGQTLVQIGPSDPTGMLLGGINTPLGFFGNQNPVVQPFGNAQASMVRGAQAGVVTSWSTYQTNVVTAGVNNITSTEYAMTVAQGTVTNSRVLIAAGDMIYINKQTSQAGLGMGNVRVSASNVLGVTFTNWTAATITPTTNQVYSIISIRGLPTVSATLSPAAVAPNATVEQQFTVTPTAANPQGIMAGSLVQVSKPTQQAGLDIVGCRAVSNNVVGITFVNVTAATITPTASEAYTIQSTQPLDAYNNYLVASLNAGAVGAIGAGLVISGGTTAFSGLLATDIPIGAASQPTAQAAATNYAIPALSIISANTMTMYFAGVGTGATPTANLTYDQLLFRLNPTAPLVIYSQLLTPASVAANTTAEQSFTVTGLVYTNSTPSVVWVNKPSWTSGLGIAGARVSASNTLYINYANSTSAAIVPPAETYLIGNFQQVGPGAASSNASGGCISQPAAWALTSTVNQVAKLRTDLVALGLWAGA
jgi:hypothetical protein